MSVWQRRAGGLTYAAVAWHKLLPPPSRINNNAVVATISAVAAVWRPKAFDDGGSSGEDVAAGVTLLRHVRITMERGSHAQNGAVTASHQQ